MSGFRQPIILLVCCSLVGSAVRADQRVSPGPTASPAGVTDVALNDRGTLTGRYLDTEGRGITDAVAVLMQGQQAIGQATTDRTGAFVFPNVRSGVYRIAVGNTSQTIRVWTAAARPPAARHLLTMVRQEPVVRGERVRDSLVAQVGIAVGVGGTIAAGVAIAQRDDARDDAAALRRVLKVTSP